MADVVDAGPGRQSSRDLAALAVGAVVVLVVLVALWVGGRTDGNPPPGSSSTVTGSDPASTTSSSVPGSGRISLGAELLADGRVRLHIPVCPGAVVTELGWVSPSETSDGVWITIAVEPAAITEAIPGEEIPGFRTATPFDGRWDALMPDVNILASATRESNGDRRRPANLAFALDDLRVGEIAYSRQVSPAMSYAESAAAFQAAVGPDCVAG